MNNEVRDTHGNVTGFRCRQCDLVKTKMWGEVCNACHAQNDSAKAHDMRAANLARLLDAFGADLANDLEWALGLMEKSTMPQSCDLAERFIAAKRHLNARRAYERACQLLRLTR